MADNKSDVLSIKVPYKNLRSAELELVSLDEGNGPGDSRSTRISNEDSSYSGNNHPHHSHQPGVSDSNRPQNCSLITLILSCMIAAGVQFGWALQLSLLTPYVQTLGIGHAFSSFIWLCGPITGLVVQPCVGIWSDKCTSKYGRRRPFILAGSLMISVAVIIIGFSADIGYLLGDTKEHCSTYRGTRKWAALTFVIGFWMLDLANNTVQGPARALLADLSGPGQHNNANAVFASWMAVGNILGFSSGASSQWHEWFPFLTNRACCEACGNLKAAFLVAVVFLILCTTVTLYFAKEIPLAPYESPHQSDSAPLLDGQQHAAYERSQSPTDVTLKEHSVMNGNEGNHEMNRNHNSSLETDDDQNASFNDGPGAVMVNLLTSLRHLPPAMHAVLIVTTLTWMSWFPFFLFDTDWMGREVYHGDPTGNSSEIKAYDQGVREGAFGLLLNSVILGIGSFLIEPMCRRIGARLVWAISCFIVFICMAGTAIISLVSMKGYLQGIEHVIGASSSTRTAALVVFAILGIPLSVTYSVPYSVTAEVTADSGGGQGLAIGVLNLAIVVPQMVVSLGAGPWDALFGGGNVPAFALASLSALAAGVLALIKLPNLEASSFKSSGIHFG